MVTRVANDLGFTEVTIAALVGHAKGSVTSTVAIAHAAPTAPAPIIPGLLMAGPRSVREVDVSNEPTGGIVRYPDKASPT